MNPVTSLDFSRKLFEIIGEQKTDERILMEPLSFNPDTIPVYTFGELLRVIPLIADNKGWKWTKQWAKDCTILYMDASTPEEGMKWVEDHLETMI